MTRGIVLVAALLLGATDPAVAQQRQTTPMQEAVDAAFALGLQTGQRVSEVLKADDDRLKWVLDNWVPKQPEPAKQ